MRYILALFMLFVTVSLYAEESVRDHTITRGEFADHLFKGYASVFDYDDAKDRKKIFYAPSYKENARVITMRRYTVMLYSYSRGHHLFMMLFKGGKLAHTMILKYNEGNNEYADYVDYTLKPHGQSIDITLKARLESTEWMGGEVGTPSYRNYRYEARYFHIDANGDVHALGEADRAAEDRILNQRYRKLLKTVPKWAKKSTIKAQRAWLRYKILRCKGDYADKFYLDDGDFCVYEETKRRNALLYQQIDDWDGYPKNTH